MADSKQFGGPGSSKIRQFGDRTAGQPGDNGDCAQCEAMLTDALDGTLSAPDQELFETHMALCGPCSQMLADARRGAAWLEMLRSPAPEPPAELLERILTQTSGSDSRIVPMPHAAFGVVVAQPRQGIAALAPGHALPAAYGNVVPFRVRAAAAFRASSFGQIMLQPRLAMTAAMAFFSVALTMNLTGVHPLSLRASDLAPSSLKRDFTNANASVVRYYASLRVVYELESRVHDLQSAQDDAAAGGPGAPAGSDQPGSAAPATQPGSAQPGSAQPGSAQPGSPQPGSPQPGSPQPKAAPQPEGGQPGGNQRERNRPAPNPGTSRREDPNQTRRLLVASTQDETGNRTPARVGRKLV